MESIPDASIHDDVVALPGVAVVNGRHWEARHEPHVHILLTYILINFGLSLFRVDIYALDKVCARFRLGKTHKSCESGLFFLQKQA